MTTLYNQLENIFHQILLDNDDVFPHTSRQLQFDLIELNDEEEDNFRINIINYESYAEYLSEFIIYCIQQYNGNTTDKIIFMCFEIFEKYIETRYETGILEKIYKSKIYEWYYGNILTFLFCVGYRYDLYATNNSYQHINHQLYIKSYDMISKYNVNIYDKDYYDNNLYNCIQNVEEKYPERIDNYYNSFKFLSKYGVRINSLQKKYLSSFYRKRKDSVKKIENYWFEILYSPYTTIGKKFLNKKGQLFDKLKNNL
jgi:hypothetical protein